MRRERPRMLVSPYSVCQKSSGKTIAIQRRSQTNPASFGWIRVRPTRAAPGQSRPSARRCKTCRSAGPSIRSRSASTSPDRRVSGYASCFTLSPRTSPGTGSAGALKIGSTVSKQLVSTSSDLASLRSRACRTKGSSDHSQVAIRPQRHVLVDDNAERPSGTNGDGGLDVEVTLGNALAWRFAYLRADARDNAPHRPAWGGLAGVLKQWQTQGHCDMISSIDVRPVVHGSR